VWLELREEVELELAMMREHLTAFAPALERSRQRAPDPIETAALGAMLHGFYNGVENIFKRIAVHCDGGPPRGEGWHSALLDRMTRPGPNRPAAVSEPLAAELRKYLRFRHVFRYAYNVQLRWEEMAELVSACQGVLEQLEAEMDAFLKATEGRQ
jgi:hypothetical protein